MQKKHIVTIAGKLGSGKSSTANRVAEILGYGRASTGDFMREIADRRGVTLGELGAIAETDPSVDEELDGQNRTLGQKENIVLDARLGFFFIPDSFKVFLELDPNVAAERILKDAEKNPARHKEVRGEYNTVEAISAAISTRLASERTRYLEKYGVKDQTAHENFDLVIDTNTLPLEGVAQKIVEEYQKWLAK